MRRVMILALLIGSATGTRAREASPGLVRLKPVEVEVVKAGIREHLTDPGSARFETGFGASREPSDTLYVCGRVISPKSFHGYAKPVVFAGMLIDDGSRFRPFSIGDGLGQAKDKAIARSCAVRGITAY